MAHFKKFQETKLPPTEGFYSKLNNSEIDRSHNEHSQQDWNEFEMERLGDYHNIYLKSCRCCSLRQCIWDLCLENYNLDLRGFSQCLYLLGMPCLKCLKFKLNYYLICDPPWESRKKVNAWTHMQWHGMLSMSLISWICIYVISKIKRLFA